MANCRRRCWTAVGVRALFGEGNIGSAPEFRTFNKGNDEPRRLLRLNVYFDNPVPTCDGYEDRGGFWAPVELWHRDAERWSELYQKGMRVLVEGRCVRDEWEDDEENTRVTFKFEARRVGILPYRLEVVSLSGSRLVCTHPNLNLILQCDCSTSCASAFFDLSRLLITKSSA